MARWRSLILRKKGRKVGGHLIGRFCHGQSVRARNLDSRVGGHLVGRFCRRPPSPCTWWSHRNPGCFQVRACCLSTYTCSLLDAPQGPSELPQCDDLLFLLFAQDIAHVTGAICPLVSVNVPDFIVGRFSADPHWPVLGDP